MRDSALAQVYNQLLHLVNSGQPYKAYYVPGRWIQPAANQAEQQLVNPFQFYLSVVTTILTQPAIPLAAESSDEWTAKSVVYNLFVRAALSFDHDGDGIIAVPQDHAGFRETGTFLKALALLPYLRQLGVNTVLVQPIYVIGEDERKGTLGSPYAVKNALRLDEQLSEPVLGLGTEIEFAAFVEAAHHLGMRVVLEFVLRVTALDSDLIPQHPDWFYWIQDSIPRPDVDRPGEQAFGPPYFEDDILAGIMQQVATRNFINLPIPDEHYRSRFTSPPRPNQVRLVGSRYIGILDNGAQVRVAEAFADFPPNDPQPLWSDICYFRLYNHPDFNYVAYNTVRMYDRRLAALHYVVTDLWNYLSAIIPTYLQRFQIDGAFLDMSQALPVELKDMIVTQARAINPGFAFWGETFRLERTSDDAGFNAVLGYGFDAQHDREEFNELLLRLSSEEQLMRFFGTPETHNTPRAAALAGGLCYARYSFFVWCVLPTILYINAGFELGERQPLNMALGSPDDARLYSTSSLGLFNPTSYDWLASETNIEWIATLLHVRARYSELLIDSDPQSIDLLPTGNPAVIAILRQRRDLPYKLLALANSDPLSPQAFRLAQDVWAETVSLDLLSARQLPNLPPVLGPGACLLLRYQ